MSRTRFGSRPVGSRSRAVYTQNSLASSASSERKHRPDYSLVLMMVLLLAIGAVTVFAISPGLTASGRLPSNYFSSKQLISIVLGSFTFIIASLISLNTWKKLEFPLIIACVVVSFAVRAFGDPINGAYRWLDVGGISFQAAELIKLTLVIWIAGLFSQARQGTEKDNQELLKKISIAVVAILIVVAGIQSDLGSAAVMMALIGGVAFVAGLPMKKLLLVGSVIFVLGFVAIISSSYRRDRVATFLNPSRDCQNEGYQACQALITVGSGGILGKGLGRSVQAYGYLPEAANDSIFAITSEKYGFFGASIIIGIFVLLFRRIKIISERSSNRHSKLVAYGVFVWLATQMMINVGAMIGLLPLKGITLPLVSFGGTSIIFVMAALGIVFNISRFTELAPVVSDKPTSPTRSRISRTRAGVNG